MNFKHPIRYWLDASFSGYGYAARGYLQALATLGIDERLVRVMPLVSHADDAVSQEDWLSENYLRGAHPHHSDDSRPEPDKTLNIVHAHPAMVGRYWARGWYNVAICAWETDRLPGSRFENPVGHPETPIESLNKYDEVWVPIRRVREAFIASGVTVPIHIVPHALTHELLDRPPRKESDVRRGPHPILSSGPKEERGEPCRFYGIGTWDGRKQPIKLVSAYAARCGWDISSPVELLLQCPRGDNAMEEWEALRASCPNTFDLPNLRILTKPRDYAWILDLHAQGHVYCTTSHGEGFCLPALEALAMGNLVVGPRTVLEHFPWAIEAGFLIPLKSTPCEVIPPPGLAGYELGQAWWDVTIDEVKRGLLEAFERAAEGLLPLEEGAMEAREQYNPAAIGRLLEPRMEAIGAVLDKSGW